MYVMGIDGGGTKTQCYVGDLNGHLLGEGFSGAANYQMCGKTIAKESIRQSIENALKAANIELIDISYVVLGLSGADEPVDYKVLKPMCSEILGDIPHVILNDTWVGLRLGGVYGVVSVCGTGGAHAGINKAGERLILRNLDYYRGNRDGGKDIVKEALHYAFRSNEGTYKKTKLEAVIPSLFGVKTMDEVSTIIRVDFIPDEVAFKLPIETFRLANKGDAVAIMIVQEMGRAQGQYAASIVKHLGMEKEKLPLVLIGSLFGTNNPYLIDPYIDEVRRIAKKAFTIIPNFPPVKGAYLLAVDAMVGVASSL